MADAGRFRWCATLALALACACLLMCVLLPQEQDHQALRRGLAPWKALAGVSATLPTGVILWSLNGTMNATTLAGSQAGYPLLFQWNSYSMYNPPNSGAGGYRATGPTLIPGKYAYQHWLVATYACNNGVGSAWQTCNSTQFSWVCPTAGVWISCVSSAAGQAMIQPNNCPVGYSPSDPSYYGCRMPLVQDGVNFLLWHGSLRLNEPAAAPQFSNQNLWPIDNGVGLQLLDISAQQNCSLVLNYMDECNWRIPGVDVQVTWAVNFYSVTPTPVNQWY